ERRNDPPSGWVRTGLKKASPIVWRIHIAKLPQSMHAESATLALGEGLRQHGACAPPDAFEKGLMERPQAHEPVSPIDCRSEHHVVRRQGAPCGFDVRGGHVRTIGADDNDSTPARLERFTEGTAKTLPEVTRPLRTRSPSAAQPARHFVGRVIRGESEFDRF